MLYEECVACRGVSCSCCHGRGFVATGLTAEDLRRHARGSPDLARLGVMRRALDRIAARGMRFDEATGVVKEARDALAALADLGTGGD